MVDGLLRLPGWAWQIENFWSCPKSILVSQCILNACPNDVNSYSTVHPLLWDSDISQVLQRRELLSRSKIVPQVLTKPLPGWIQQNIYIYIYKKEKSLLLLAYITLFFSNYLYECYLHNLPQGGDLVYQYACFFFPLSWWQQENTCILTLSSWKLRGNLTAARV